jgi:hypothetical protein
MQILSNDLAGRARVSMPPPVQVVQVFPSAQTVPENLLRFHVFFSSPPEVHRLLDAVRLIDDQGDVVPQPFLDLEHGLWDAGGTRLTLLLHPGRIKSGLIARARLGSALGRGRRYQLQIDMDLLTGAPDAGTVLHVQMLHVGSPLAGKVRLPVMQHLQPGAGTFSPLRIDFARPMDRLGLEDGLLLKKADGTDAGFDLQIEPGEQVAHLLPASAWAAEPYRLLFSPELEDVAGNRPGSGFEVESGLMATGPEGVPELTFEPLLDV